MNEDSQTPGPGAERIAIDPVAIIRSPFEERFGIPRQAGLVDEAVGEVRFLAPYDDPVMLQGLDAFSHLWLIFQFHGCVDHGWRPRVRPPRLGGNREVGVWASRSPFRPNFIGLSVVRLIEVVVDREPYLRVGGIDLLDGTPVLDIKPYLPYSDVVPGAHGGYAQDPPAARLAVHFSAAADRDLAQRPDAAELQALIRAVLALDPRPAYRAGPEPDRVYGMRLAGLDLRWSVSERGAEVRSLRPVGDG